MRLAAAFLLLALGACSKEAPPPLDIAQSKQMIWDAIKLYHESDDKRELDTIGGLIDTDASLAVGFDNVVRGHDPVVKAIKERHKTYSDARSTITGKELISITGDMALVTYVASVGTQRGIITSVCRRNKAGKWLIAHIHETWSLQK